MTPHPQSPLQSAQPPRVPHGDTPLGHPFELQWFDTQRQPQSHKGLTFPSLAQGNIWKGNVWNVALQTSEGCLETCFYPTEGAPNRATPGGVVYIGGMGSCCDNPSGFFPNLALRLQEKSIAGLHFSCRQPHDLTHCVLDALLGVEFLRREGLQKIALVGHAFGGAVALTAASRCPHVNAVATLSTQTVSTQCIENLASRSLLFIHGEADEVNVPR